MVRIPSGPKSPTLESSIGIGTPRECSATSLLFNSFKPCKSWNMKPEWSPSRLKTSSNKWIWISNDGKPAMCSVGPNGSRLWSQLSSASCCPCSSWDLWDSSSMLIETDGPSPLSRRPPGCKWSSPKLRLHQCTNQKSPWAIFIDCKIRDQLCPLSCPLCRTPLSKGRHIKLHFVITFLFHIYCSPITSQP